VLLEAGNRVPADGRLFVAAGLPIDESALTGESTPAAMRAATLNGDREQQKGLRKFVEDAGNPETRADESRERTEREEQDQGSVGIEPRIVAFRAAGRLRTLPIRARQGRFRAPPKGGLRSASAGPAELRNDV
jgi:magnesium-transporting ATPase (P-type)